MHLQTPLDLRAGQPKVGLGKLLPVPWSEKLLDLVIRVSGRAVNLFRWSGHLQAGRLMIDIDCDLFSGQVIFDVVLHLLRLPDLLIDDGKVLLQVVLRTLGKGFNFKVDK